MIGAGMAGRAHASGYRSAPAVFGPDLPAGAAGRHRRRARAVRRRHRPAVRLPARRDELAGRSPRRPTSTRSAWWWPTRCTARSSRRLLDAGKHVLCEKPLAPSVADGQAMVDRGRRSPTGSPRSASPSAGHRPSTRSASRSQRQPRPGPCTSAGTTGATTASTRAPDELALPGRPRLRGARRHRHPPGRPGRVPLRPGAGVQRRRADHRDPGPARPAGRGGRATPAASGQRRAGAGRERGRRDVHRRLRRRRGRHVLVSRVAYGHANALGFEVFCQRGAAAFDLNPAGGVHIADAAAATRRTVYRQVLIGPAHPYIARACRWTFPASATGRTTSSPSRRGPSWTDRRRGHGCRPARDLAHGLHNLRVARPRSRSASRRTSPVHARRRRTP